MNDREKIRTEYEARERVGDPHRNTSRGEAVNRYVGAFGYLQARADHPAPVTPAASREGGRR